MQMPFNLSRYVPEFLRDIKEFRVIYESENTELAKLEILRRQAIANRFYNEMDKETCGRYESDKVLNLTVNAGDILDDRRFRIKSILNFTNHYLIKSLVDLCGNNNINVQLNADKYYIEIRLALMSESKNIEAQKLIRRMLPCNMKLNYYMYAENKIKSILNVAAGVYYAKRRSFIGLSEPVSNCEINSAVYIGGVFGHSKRQITIGERGVLFADLENYSCGELSNYTCEQIERGDFLNGKVE